VIGNVIAGLVLVLTRPLRPGEQVTIAGRTGTVREITLMRVRILLPNGEDEVLIPSSKILTSTILRKKRDFF
jgi:small-conductance mechanosensitive channel